MTSSLSQISIYPVKSIRGVQLSNAQVEFAGLQFDRRFMLAGLDGSMITARKYPELLKVEAILNDGGMTLSYPGCDLLCLEYSKLNRKHVKTEVWNQEFIAYSTTLEANQWFSDVLKRPVQFLYCGEEPNRYRENTGTYVSFADGYPLLLISEASLQALNQRSPVQNQMAQFRPNLVISGTEPFAEDSWKRFRIGEVEFEVRKPCTRCILTTADPESAQFHPLQEPLATLSRFRVQPGGDIDFGQNVIALNEGVIKVGESVEVLEWQSPATYPDSSTSNMELVCTGRETIARDFTTFWFQTKKGESFPSYQAGQHLPFQIAIGGELVSRCYTLSSFPGQKDKIGISVKRVEEGLVSNFMHDHFSIGGSIVASQPSGQFVLDESTQPLVFLSAGSGITPMLSMLRELEYQGNHRKLVFYHQCRSMADIPCQDELESIAATRPGFQLIIALTQPEPEWSGVQGRFSLQHLSLLPRLSDYKAYVCGPQGFMERARAFLMEHGLQAGHYHQEVFKLADRAAGERRKLSISINGELFTGHNQQTLLEQAEEAGIPSPYSCRAGQCGACKMQLESGEVDQPDLPALSEQEYEQGIVLACSCYPQTDVELRSL